MTEKPKPVAAPARCHGCSRTWQSYTQCHCALCHAHFSSPRTFDMHLVRGGHTRPEDVRDRQGYRMLVLIERVTGGGAVWAHRDTTVPAAVT